MSRSSGSPRRRCSSGVHAECGFARAWRRRRLGCGSLATSGTPGRLAASPPSAARSRLATMRCWTATRSWQWSSARPLEGLLVDFGQMDVLRQRLLELMAFEQHAVVFEARYEDLLSPEKVHHWSAAFCARAIADLYARFPRLRLVFCSNRKTAAEWTRHYFAAVWTMRGHVGEPLDEEASGRGIEDDLIAVDV